MGVPPARAESPGLDAPYGELEGKFPPAPSALRPRAGGRTVRGAGRSTAIPRRGPAPESLVTDIRYPIGPFALPADTGDAARRRWIDEISRAPAALRAAVDGLTPAQLDTPYGEGGWSPRQIVHHVADSHMNAYIRFKLALTENAPTIAPYDQASWAMLHDTARVPVDTSLALLDALHERWVAILRGMTPSDFERGYTHPEHRRVVPLVEATAMYAWHGRHHAAHITGLRKRNGW